MEAKDTVIGEEKRTQILNQWLANHFKDKTQDWLSYIILDVAQIQAEPSFKAGIREVVEWIETPGFGIRDDIRAYCENVWQDKLKEWGIEENK
jgi:hypothetical protein